MPRRRLNDAVASKLEHRTLSVEDCADRAHHRRMHHIYTDEEMLRRLKQPPGVGSFWALRHFARLVETRRRQLLLEARRRGWSWYDLAVALGVSRQAVQQQWQRLVGPDPEPDD